MSDTSYRVTVVHESAPTVTVVTDPPAPVSIIAGLQGPPGNAGSLKLESFIYDGQNTIQPSQTPIGSVLVFLHGQLNPAFVIPDDLEIGDEIALVYLA